MKKIILHLTGMHCTSCSVLIDTVLEELPGVKTANTSYANQKVEVEYDPALIDIPTFIATIKKEGYDVTK